MKGFDYYLNRAAAVIMPQQDAPVVEEDDNNEGQGSSSSAEDDHHYYYYYYVNYRRLKKKLSEYVLRRKKFNELMLMLLSIDEDADAVSIMEDDDEDPSINSLLDELYPPSDDEAGSSNDYPAAEVMMCEGTTNACGMTISDATDYFVFYDDTAAETEAEATTSSTHYNNQLRRRRRRQLINNPSEAKRRLSNLERDDFCSMLEKEIEKASVSYKNQLAGVQKSILSSSSSEIVQQQQQQQQQSETDDGIDNNSSSSSDSNRRRLQAIGDELLEVFAFEVINVITIRQIMIRYDAFVRTFDSEAPLSEWYLLQRQSNNARLQGADDDYFHDLFSLDELEKVQNDYIVNLQQHPGTENYLQQFTSQSEHFQALLDKTFQSVERAAAGHIVFRDRIVAILIQLQQYFLVGSALDNRLSLEPKTTLRMRGRHLKREMKSVAKWRETKRLVKDSKTDDDDRLDPENVVPLILNIISCFLFMMNNYVIEPSSAYYANALGVNDALSGMMIGMASWFALSAAVGYSFWTNASYKHPILFAGLLMTIGNWMYANAYTYESIEMCLIGRAVQGLGAPRIINRRYVADATPFSLRTMSSAAFATATALGAALGPGLAIILDLFDFEFHVPVLGQQTFNGMTGPGYFMALAWTLYSISIVFLFKEPNRSGLDELKRREEKAKTSKDGSASASTKLISTSVPPPNEGSSKVEFPFDDEEDEDAAEELGGYDSESEYAVLKTATMSSRTTNTKSRGILYQCGCCKHITGAVTLCMFLILSKRIALESIVGSTSIVTKNRYGWSIKNVGTLHLVNGIIVIPVTIMAGYLSRFYEDRHLASWFLCITLFGMVFLIDVTDLFVTHANEGYNDDLALSVGPIQYIAGSLIAFSGIEACESYVASLMTKVTPSSLAVGTFNSGLLTTLVGTGGRAVGDLFITAMGLISIRNLLNLLIIPGTILMLLSIILLRKNFKIVAV